MAPSLKHLVLLGDSIFDNAACTTWRRSGQASAYSEWVGRSHENWRFVPATENGRPVPAVAEVPVAFRLEDPAPVTQSHPRRHVS